MAQKSSRHAILGLTGFHLVVSGLLVVHQTVSDRSAILILRQVCLIGCVDILRLCIGLRSLHLLVSPVVIVFFKQSAEAPLHLLPVITQPDLATVSHGSSHTFVRCRISEDAFLLGAAVVEQAIGKRCV